MVTVNASGPTLHHEDDIRIEGRIEEVDQSLGAQLSCTGAGSVSGALHTPETKMEPKQTGRLETNTTVRVTDTIKLCQKAPEVHERTKTLHVLTLL